jgi:hypothetical protein
MGWREWLADIDNLDSFVVGQRIRTIDIFRAVDISINTITQTADTLKIHRL